MNVFIKKPIQPLQTFVFTTATIKYSNTFLCEVATFGTAPSYVAKPICFAFGTLTSNLYKASFKNDSLQFSDYVFTSISTAARVSEYFLPKYLADYGVPFDFSFYITTLLEGALSLFYQQSKSDYQLNKPLENNTIPDYLTCVASLPQNQTLESYIQPPDYYITNDTCNLEFAMLSNN